MLVAVLVLGQLLLGGRFFLCAVALAAAVLVAAAALDEPGPRGSAEGSIGSMSPVTEAHLLVAARALSRARALQISARMIRRHTVTAATQATM